MKKAFTIATLRKKISSSQPKEIANLLVELYRTNTTASRQIDVFFNANSLEDEYQEAKKRITKAFDNPSKIPNLSTVKRNISDFKKFNPLAEKVIDLELIYVTNLAEFLESFDGPDSYYKSLLSVTNTLALNCMQANLSLTESQTEQLKVVLDLLLEYGWEPEYYVFDILDLPYEQLWY